MPLEVLGLGRRVLNALLRSRKYADVSELVFAEWKIRYIHDVGAVALREIDESLRPLFERARRTMPTEASADEEGEQLVRSARIVASHAADPSALWSDIPQEQRLPLANRFFHTPVEQLELDPDVAAEFVGAARFRTIGDLFAVHQSWERESGLTVQAVAQVHERLVALAQQVVDHEAHQARWSQALAALARREDLAALSLHELGWTKALVDACPGSHVAHLAALSEAEATELWAKLRAWPELGIEPLEEVERLAALPADRTEDEWAADWRARGIEVLPEGYTWAAGDEHTAHALSRVLRELVTEVRNEEDWTVLQRRLGLLDAERLTLQQLGEAFGVTRERIRQRELGAIAVVRAWHHDPVGTLSPARLHPALRTAMAALAAMFDEVLASPLAEADFIRRCEAIMGPQADGVDPLTRLMAELRGLTEVHLPGKGPAPVWAANDKPTVAEIKQRVMQIHKALTEGATAAHTAEELAAAVNERAAEDARITVPEIGTFAPLCSTVERLENGLYQGRYEHLRSRFRQAERILLEAGEPLHLSEIRRIINHRASVYGGKPVEAQNLSNQLSLADQLVAIGRSGFWAYAGWRDIELGTVVELMERSFLEHDRPLRPEELYAWVAARRRVSETSIPIYLTTDDRFSRVDRERWALARWKVSRTRPIWDRTEVADFVATLYKTRETEALPYAVVRDALMEAADVSIYTAQGLLAKNPVIETAKGDNGERIAQFQPDYRDRLEGKHKRHGVGVEYVREVSQRLLADQPEQRMPLKQLRDLLMQETGISKASVYYCVKHIAELETTSLPNTAGKLVRWVERGEEVRE